MTSPGTNEQSINVALGEVLAGMRRGWNVLDERNGALDGGGRADVLVLDESGWPVVVEAEREDHASAEDDAIARLGRRPAGGEHAIETAVALVYPPEFQQLSGAALRDAIRTTDALEYALYTHVRDDERGRERLPESGWLRGGVIDFAMLVHRAATPAPRVEALADALAGGIGDAADRFSHHHPRFGEGRGAQLAAILEQTDDAKGQTRRMAMTVLLNALIFHEALAQADFEVWTGTQQRPVLSIDVFCGLMLKRAELLEEWRAILHHNYLPIFSTARRLLAPSLMPIMTVSDVLQPLCFTAQSLVRSGVTRSHDLMGTVVQRLIADRKFLAANYTRPEAAALLAGLALPVGDPPRGSWGDGETLASVQDRGLRLRHGHAPRRRLPAPLPPARTTGRRREGAPRPPDGARAVRPRRAQHRRPPDGGHAGELPSRHVLRRRVPAGHALRDTEGEARPTTRTHRPPAGRRCGSARTNCWRRRYSPVWSRRRRRPRWAGGGGRTCATSSAAWATANSTS